MSSTEPTGAWADAMLKAGIGDPRNGRPSWTRLAKKANTSVSTVTNAVFHRTTPSAATIQALATALRVTPETISEWIGLPGSPVGRPYVPTNEAALLSQIERDALDDLIRALARREREERGGDGRDAAPTIEARAVDDMVTLLALREDTQHISDEALRTAATLVVREGLARDAAVAAATEIHADPGGDVTELKPRGGRPPTSPAARRPMAARPGLPDNPVDGTTGEDSQEGPADD